VDLDGTLIRQETHHLALQSLRGAGSLKTVCQLMGLWLMKGAWHAKVFALMKSPRSVLDDVKIRPFMVDFLRREKEKGREIILITGAPYRVARFFQKKCPFIDRVFASYPGFNCVGRAKERLLKARYGLYGFDYVGNSVKDLYVWRSSYTAYGVSVSKWTTVLWFFYEGRHKKLVKLD